MLDTILMAVAAGFATILAILMMIMLAAVFFGCLLTGLLKLTIWILRLTGN